MTIGGFSTLDDFDRPDTTISTGGLGPNWSKIAQFSGGDGYYIHSNAAAGGHSGTYGMYWNAATFGPDCEFQLMLNAFSPASMAAVGARLFQDPATAFPSSFFGCGYWFGHVYTSFDLTTQPPFPDSPSSLASTFDGPSQDTLPYGIAIRCEGNVISGLIKDSPTLPWRVVLSATDSEFPGAGWVGFKLSNAYSASPGSEVGEEVFPDVPAIGQWRHIQFGRTLQASQIDALTIKVDRVPFTWEDV